VLFVSGVWAIDLANQKPKSIEIHAADISPSNFPPSHPLNVHFCIASAASLPPEWTGKFDFINQRFLFGALLAKEWPKALSEFHRTLKPGGAVQLIEMAGTAPVPETPTCVAHTEISQKVFTIGRLDFTIAGRLSELLLAAGFVDVVSEKKLLPTGRLWGEIGMQGSLSIGGAMKNMAGFVAKSKVCDSDEEYEGLLDKIKEEWNLHGSQYPCRVVCARKSPL